jgi:exonuclease SbcC
MSWFNDLLRNPPAKSPAQPLPGRPAAPSAAPVVDPDAARAALVAATDEQRRRVCAEELGCALAARLQPPQPDDGPAVWVAAVSQVGDKSLALQWLGGLDGDSWLGDVALHGRYAEARLAAAERITDGEVLERVARLSRGKDKGVFRHCSDELRQRRECVERAQRTERLAGALNELLAHSPLSVSGLLDLQRELHALDDGGEALAQCRTLMDRADARLRQESEARRSLQGWRDEAAEVAAQCMGAAWPGAEQLDRWRDRCATLAQAHAALPAWLADGGSSHALAASLHQIEARLTALTAEAARMQACEQFLAALGSSAIEPGTSAAWDALPKPDHAECREMLQARWQAAMQTMHSPPPPEAAPARAAEPRARPHIDTGAVRALLEQMEQALEEGHLADADATAKRIKAAVGSAALRGEVASRLQRAQTRLGDLSGWAKWGAEQKREDLIAAAEELLSANRDVDYLANAVPALRQEWKRLNGQAAPAHGEWERFDAALSKAYQPVAVQRAEEAARRAQARSDKEALCVQWDAFVAAIDWEHPDTAAIKSAREQMLNQWRTAPLAGFRDERTLRKRFDALLGQIDQRLAETRNAEIQRREQLITAAEALREMPDLRAAMTGAKSLQERWRNEAGTLRLPRGDEQKLWRRFRGACDSVFARRDAERAEQVAQREKQAQERVALLDALASALQATDAGQIKRALAQFRAEWDGAKAGAGALADGLEPRARELQQCLQRRIETLQRDAYRTRLEALAQQAKPADGADPEALAAGRNERESLLIDLEIALDLPTPEDFAAARRRRQLERLQNRFRGGPPPQQPRAEELLTRWYAIAASPDEAMNQRVSAVVRKLVEQAQAAARK